MSAERFWATPRRVTTLSRSISWLADMSLVEHPQKLPIGSPVAHDPVVPQAREGGHCLGRSGPTHCRNLYLPPIPMTRILKKRRHKTAIINETRVRRTDLCLWSIDHNPQSHPGVAVRYRLIVGNTGAAAPEIFRTRCTNRDRVADQCETKARCTQ